MAVKNGTEKADTLKGTAKADTIYGNGGNDTITGLAGNDRLDGGTGADKIDGGTGDDRIEGGEGYDRNTLRGGDGNDLVGGGRGDDTMYGDKGNDRLFGGEGNDAYYGGAGSDRFSFEVSPTSVSGHDVAFDFQKGADTIKFGTYGSFGDLDSNGDGFLTAADDYISGGKNRLDIDVGKAYGIDDDNYSYNDQVLSVVNVTSLTESDVVFI